MDRLALATLREEILEDCRVFREAVDGAGAHLEKGTHGRLEATAFDLARAYNIFEQMALRIAREFENNIDRSGGWHELLLRRMTLQVPGVRPALIGADVKRDLDELRRFRHIVNHAYDLQLREDRIRELASIAGRLAPSLHSTCDLFVHAVAEMHGLERPPESH